VQQRVDFRLAEVVAALSLGIDLGFGQPMEHVLRQTLIALRVAERIGLAADERSDVYYTALLIGVGCHTDAHEQAKWFGDDLELKSDKYDYEFRTLRATASGMRRSAPAIRRFTASGSVSSSCSRDAKRSTRWSSTMRRWRSFSANNWN
jgi:hypothetical protein